MARIRKINVSQVEGNSNAVLPEGTIVAFDFNGEYRLRVHDGVTAGGVPFPNAPNIVHDNDINITVNSEDSSSYTWNFGQTGALTLPDGSPILFGGNNCRIQALQAFSISSDGGIAVEVTDKQWLFNPDGTTRFPNDTLDAGTNEIYIQSSNSVSLAYSATDGTWQSEPARNQLAGLAASYDGIGITLVRGDDGEEGPQWSHEWLFNKDGDITLPAGGDILDSTGASVLGGAANEITNTDGEAQPSTYSVSVGTDGVVTMTTSRGVLEFGALPEPGAQSHFHIMRAAGENADLYFGDDFNYVLQRGPAYNGSPAYGVEIGANDNNSGDQQVWRFGTDGGLSFPDGSFIDDSIAFLLGARDNLIIRSDSNDAQHDWIFGSNGSLTFPDSTVQTTAYTGPQTSLDGDVTGSVFADDSTLLVDGVSGIVPNSELAKSITQVIDSNATVNTSATITTNNSYTNTVDFSTDVDPGVGYTLDGWYQRNSEQIEFALFGPGSFQTYLTGLALGRTVIVTYSTGSGNQTITRPLTQRFTETGQTDPANPTWGRVSGRIDATLPADQTGIVSINFPVYSVESHTWQFGDDGSLTLPGGSTRIGTLLGSDAIIANEDTAFGVVTQGTNGSGVLLWIEDSENFGTSNLAAVYTNPEGSGTVRIATGANGGPGPKFWTFNDSGALTFPQGTTIGTADGGEFLINGAADKDVYIYTYSGETARGWTFGTDGGLTFPDSTVQTTAWTGTTTGAITAERFNTDQITVVGNRISTTVTNANLEIECNGSGGVVINTVADATTASTTKSVGYLGLPQSATATSATLAIGDAGKHIYVTTNSQTITIPAAASVDYPIGTTLTFIAGPSATTVSIAITSDTLRLAGGTSTGTRTLAANGMATAVKVAATTWYINGVGLT